MESIAYLIMLDDHSVAATVENLEHALQVLEELSVRDFAKIQLSFKSLSYEDYKKVFKWRIKEVPLY